MQSRKTLITGWWIGIDTVHSPLQSWTLLSSTWSYQTVPYSNSIVVLCCITLASKGSCHSLFFKAHTSSTITRYCPCIPSSYFGLGVLLHVCLLPVGGFLVAIPIDVFGMILIQVANNRMDHLELPIVPEWSVIGWLIQAVALLEGHFGEHPLIETLASGSEVIWPGIVWLWNMKYCYIIPSDAGLYLLMMLCLRRP